MLYLKPTKQSLVVIFVLVSGLLLFLTSIQFNFSYSNIWNYRFVVGGDNKNTRAGDNLFSRADLSEKYGGDTGILDLCVIYVKVALTHYNYNLCHY